MTDRVVNLLREPVGVMRRIKLPDGHGHGACKEAASGQGCGVCEYVKQVLDLAETTEFLLFHNHVDAAETEAARAEEGRTVISDSEKAKVTVPAETPSGPRVLTIQARRVILRWRDGHVSEVKYPNYELERGVLIDFENHAYFVRASDPGPIPVFDETFEAYVMDLEADDLPSIITWGSIDGVTWCKLEGDDPPWKYRLARWCRADGSVISEREMQPSDHRI